MNMPLGLTCKKCGNVIGTIVRPDSSKLTGLGVVAVCPACLNQALSDLSLVPSDEEKWAKLIKHMGV